MTFDPNNFLILPVHPQYSQPLKESGSKGLNTLLEKIKDTVSSILMWLSGERIPPLEEIDSQAYVVSTYWGEGKPKSATALNTADLAQRGDQAMSLEALMNEFKPKLNALTSAISLINDRLQPKGTITLSKKVAQDLTQQVNDLRRLFVKIEAAKRTPGISKYEAVKAEGLLCEFNSLRNGVIKDLDKSIIYTQ